mgnify:FL=1
MDKKSAVTSLINHNDFCLQNNSEMASLGLEARKPSLLLHACCGPCSTSCVERLADEYQITLYYYNPNITDREEYFLRRENLIKFIDAFNKENAEKGIFVDFLDGRYDPERFLSLTEKLNDEPEGGKRCDVCFAMRLSDTAVMAGKLGMDYFTTVMSVSPHKNYEKIAELGFELEKSVNADFLDIDFKKKNGFGRSVELSKKYGLYRQNFCGCDYARQL